MSSEYEVVWPLGKEPMPHELQNRHLWRTTGNVTDHAPAPRHGDLPGPDEGGSGIPSAAGYWRAPVVRPRGRPKGSRNLVNGKLPPPRLTCCTACQAPLTANQQKKRIIRCNRCRKARGFTRRAA